MLSVEIIESDAVFSSPYAAVESLDFWTFRRQPPTSRLPAADSRFADQRRPIARRSGSGREAPATLQK
jgi:hypothetical protein